MNGIFFYKDSVDTFECDIKVEGASSNSTFARLIMEFSDRTLLFNGEIKDGHVSVMVPKLSEIKDPNGNATLEVVADQTYFKAWESPFELKSKKNVSIGEVKINNSTTNVVVENISKDISKTKEKSPGIIKESCSDKNKRFITKSFNRFKSMEKEERKQIKETLKDFVPKNTIKKWADSVFEDSNTMYAKYCMYELQKGFYK